VHSYLVPLAKVPNKLNIMHSIISTYIIISLNRFFTKANHQLFHFSFSSDLITCESVLRCRRKFSFWKSTVSIPFVILIIFYYRYLTWVNSDVIIIVLYVFKDPKMKHIIQRQYESPMVSSSELLFYLDV